MLAASKCRDVISEGSVRFGRGDLCRGVFAFTDTGKECRGGASGGRPSHLSEKYFGVVERIGRTLCLRVQVRTQRALGQRESLVAKGGSLSSLRKFAHIAENIFT
jgi:hypothetical protein